MKRQFYYRAPMLIILLLVGLYTSAQLQKVTGLGFLYKIDSARSTTYPTVIKIYPESGAEAAGLQFGDLITKVNGTSTANKNLKELQEIFKSDGSSSSRLDVDRKGSAKSITITRKEFEYTASNYITAKPDDAICSTLAKLMNDAPYNFKHYMGEKLRVDSGTFNATYYRCKLQLPDAKRVEIRYSFLSWTCEISYGVFNSSMEAMSAIDKPSRAMKECFPDFYAEVDMTKALPVGMAGYETSTMFESPIIHAYASKRGNTHEALLSIEGGDKTRNYKITGEPATDEFSKSVRKILAEVPNDFAGVKGQEHVEKGFFSRTWYETNTTPTGAKACSFEGKGSMNLASGCTCSFYSGDSESEAKAVYDKLAKQLFAAFGKDFVYNIEKPTISHEIPSTAYSVMNFGRKTKRAYEKASMCSLYSAKTDKGQDDVSMVFHKGGF